MGCGGGGVVLVCVLDEELGNTIERREEMSWGLVVRIFKILSRKFVKINHLWLLSNIYMKSYIEIVKTRKGEVTMSSIKDFAKQNKENKQTEIREEDLKKTQDDYSDLIQLFMSNYGTMNEDELISEMLKLIQQKKENGTFDGQKLRELAERVSPFLNAEQRSKMYDMMNYLD